MATLTDRDRHIKFLCGCMGVGAELMPHPLSRPRQTILLCESVRGHRAQAIQTCSKSNARHIAAVRPLLYGGPPAPIPKQSQQPASDDTSWKEPQRSPGFRSRNFATHGRAVVRTARIQSPSASSCDAASPSTKPEMQTPGKMPPDSAQSKLMREGCNKDNIGTNNGVM